MNLAQPDQPCRQYRLRQLLPGCAISLAALLLTTSCSKFSAPVLEKSSVKWGTVKKGELVRLANASGVFVPDEPHNIPALTDGLIINAPALPGSPVKAGTVLLELQNPEVKRQAAEAEWQFRSAEAQHKKLKLQLEEAQISLKSSVASLKAESEQAQLQAQSDETLLKEGVVPALVAKRSRARADYCLERLAGEQERLRLSADLIAAQTAEQQANVEKNRLIWEGKQHLADALTVRSGIDGVLAQLGEAGTWRTGQSMTTGTILARVVEPSKLKAELKLTASQAGDVRLGQPVNLDLHNGGQKIPGHVTRVDPNPRSGMFTVDVKLDGALPANTRPNQSVDGLIELERMPDAIYVERPVAGMGDSILVLFKITSDGSEAVRMAVKFGRSSTDTIQVLEGLQIGDIICVSDLSAWEKHSRLRLK